MKRKPPPISHRKLSKLKEKRASFTTLDIKDGDILKPRLLRPSDLLTKRARAPGRKGSKRLNQLGKKIFSDALSKEVLEAKSSQDRQEKKVEETSDEKASHRNGIDCYRGEIRKVAYGFGHTFCCASSCEDR